MGTGNFLSDVASGEAGEPGLELSKNSTVMDSSSDLNCIALKCVLHPSPAASGVIPVGGNRRL